MYDNQEGCCTICGSQILLYAIGKEKVNTCHVDHNHVTGEVRSLLCAECNTGLGKFRDSPELLQKAATYIKRYTNELN